MNGIAVLLSLLVAIGDDDCKPPGKNARAPCMRGGFCFDLSIDGQEAVPLEDEALGRSLEEALSRSVCWTLRAPVVGTLEPEVRANSLTAEHLGELYDEVEIVVIGLEDQEIPTKKGIRTDPTVLIGGVPMQTVVDVIDVEALPDGAYVVTFRVRGPGGWDRKAVYLRVERAP